MKKKLFLIVAMVAIMVFAFAFSVSAVTGSTSNEYGKVTEIDDEGLASLAKTYSDHTSRAVVQNADGTYTTYPAYYIYNGSTSTNMLVDFTKLSNATGENYTKASLIRVEVFANARLNWTFDGCTGLIDVYLPDGVFLHYASFVGCSSLPSIVLPNTGVTQIPTDCFSGCNSLASVNIPDTVTSLGQRCFQNCNSLSEIKIPAGYTGIIAQDFRKITNGSSVAVTYIVPKGCTGINSQYSIDNCNVSKIIFTGTEDSAFIANVKEKKAGALSMISYVNHCDVYFGGVHKETEELSKYFEGEMFVSKFIVESPCGNGCGETAAVATVDKLFKFLGYSKTEIPGSYAFSNSFAINHKAIEQYNSYVDEDEKLTAYGLIATAKKNAEDGNLMDASKKAPVEYTGKAYDIISMKVSNITEENWATELYCTAYVFVNGKYYYASNTAFEEAATQFVSYESLS